MENIRTAPNEELDREEIKIISWCKDRNDLGAILVAIKLEQIRRLLEK